jgi:hypothetical protein
MKTLLLTTALAILALPALAEVPTAPAGAAGLACDITQFTPILGDDGTTVLYWNNPTCPNGQGGMDPDHPAFRKPLPVVEDPEDEEEDEEVPLDLAKA